METKRVTRIVAPGRPHFVGDGFRVHNFIPGGGIPQERADPFILLDYNSKYDFPASEIPKGVGVHPHRGFETVTIAYKGRVEHGDSAGGGGIIGEGDVQWMSAASGVLHKEHHETQWSKTGGEFQMVQLWVNLPAKDKMSTPKYQAIKNADMAKVQLENDAGFVEIIAGEYQGEKGPAKAFSPVNLMNAKLNKGGKATFHFPANHTTALLMVEGSVLINGSEKLPQDHFALFANEGKEFAIEASEEAIALVLSGEPLKEPIVSHGPFVMNTHQQIQEAIHDFNVGKFGYLED